MFKTIHRLARAIIILAFGSLILFFAIILYFVIGLHSQTHASQKTDQLSSAFWMEHAWSASTQSANAKSANAKTDADFQTLLSQITALSTGTPVKDLYFHTGSINEDGSAATDLSIPTTRLAALSGLGITNYAWLGQVRAKINLEDPTVRAKIISSSTWLISQGFDGIHLDIEPVRKDDESFFTLLEELRAALPDTKLSIATDEWQPHFISQLMAWFYEVDIESYWTTGQIKRAADYADQIVIMTYDTNFKDPDLYTWWVEQQTVALSNILSSASIATPTELLIGLPSYETGLNIDPDAENLQTGLAGLLRGLKNLRGNPNAITGYAIYAYWEIDAEEWSLLQSNEF